MTADTAAPGAATAAVRRSPFRISGLPAPSVSGKRPYGKSTASGKESRQNNRVIWRRPGQVGPCPDADLVAAIREVLAASPFHGEGYRKVWARLRMTGVRPSRRRVLRLMREHGLLAPSRAGGLHGPRPHDGTLVTEQVEEMGGTDLTTVMAGERMETVFIAVDHGSTECIGIHAATSATRFEARALEPIRQGVRRCYSGFAENIASGLALRHDHGSQYTSHNFQNEIAFLGITSSPSFVRALEGNGCAERFIRTLKENLLWVHPFDTMEELRLALLDFQRLYNETWVVERHGYRTPAAIRAAQRRQPALAA